MTRTVKVRLDLPNPGSRLKPDMFVDVEFLDARATAAHRAGRSVLDTASDRRCSSISERVPRAPAGASRDRLGDRVSVLSGLAAGERVVASGTFCWTPRAS